jgi:hypothetical protein
MQGAELKRATAQAFDQTVVAFPPGVRIARQDLPGSMTGHHASMVATRRQARPCQSFIRKAALSRDLGIGYAAGPWIDQPLEQFDAFGSTFPARPARGSIEWH